MKKNIKLIILSSTLLVIITLITLAMIFDIDMFLFKNLSIAGIQEKKMSVEELMAKQTMEEASNLTAKSELQTSKNNFDVAKEEYDNINESTISMVQEATKQEKYFVEYLWIVLGNYATSNNVDISIITPGSTIVEKNEQDSENNENDSATTEQNNTINQSSSVSPLRSGIKIIIEGRYADVADFVYDVEHDKSLRFKLDNISMTYAEDNRIKATFDVLSLSVLK